MRERLIELVGQATARCNGTFCWDCEYKNEIQDGRCCSSFIADHLLANGVIVPPCKANDKIFAIGAENGVLQIKECNVDYLGFENANGLEVHVMFECDEDCEGCYFSSWSQMHCGEWTCDGEYGEGVIPFDDFGKTVFLTREEAEQALKGESHEHD